MDVKKRITRSKQNLFFNIIYSQTITANSNIKNVTEIINFLLSSKFNLKTYGYNRRENEYWGKKMDNNLCYLYFNIKICELNVSSCEIVITSLIDTNNEFKNLVNMFYSRIYAYNILKCTQ